MGRLLEVCIASLPDALVAASAGADRVELNRALDLDGLTPPRNLVREVVDAIDLPVITMVRPRGGDFIYDDHEFTTLLAEITVMIDNGAAGVAVGILHGDGRIDVDRMAEVMHRAKGVDVVFHRAFDVARSRHQALDQLIELGISRVLTSGQQPTALEGIATLRDLIEHAGDRIEILPGAGIRPENVSTILKATGCTQVHGTFRDAAGIATDPEAVRAVRQRLDAYAERLR